MSTLGMLRSGITELGWQNGLLYFVSRALQSITRGHCRVFKYYFVAQPVRYGSQVQSSRKQSILVRQVLSHDPIVKEFPRPPSVLTRRFAQGSICFVATHADRLVGFLWIHPNHYMEDEVRCLYSLVPDGVAAWDYDVYVVPEFRLGRAFSRLWDAANQFLSDRGYRWSVSRISAFNPASLASHRRLGIRFLQTGVFAAFGPIQLALFSCTPFFHFSIRTSQYPVLRLGIPADGQVCD